MFSMLHSCLYLTPTWCPNVLTQLVMLIRPNEVSLLHHEDGKCNGWDKAKIIQRNLPLHIAASAVAATAAAQKRELDEKERMKWKKHEHEIGEDVVPPPAAAPYDPDQHFQNHNELNSSTTSWRMPYFSLDDTLHYHTTNNTNIYHNNNDNDDDDNHNNKEKGKKESIVDALLECYPEAASIPNGDGFLPFQLIVGSECLGGCGVMHNDDEEEEEELVQQLNGKKGKDSDDDTNDEKWIKCNSMYKEEENDANVDQENAIVFTRRRKTGSLSSPTWSEDVGSVLLAYPQALESLDLSDEMYPSILSRFTGGLCDDEKLSMSRSIMADFNTLFILLKERPDLVYTHVVC